MYIDVDHAGVGTEGLWGGTTCLSKAACLIRPHLFSTALLV